MSDDVTTTERTSSSGTPSGRAAGGRRGGAGVDETVGLLAELRGRVEEATAEIERLTTELVERSKALDEMESVADAVLGATETPVVVVGTDRRVRAVSRGAAALLEVDGPPAGRPLSALLPDEVVEVVTGALDAPAPRPAARRASGDEADGDEDEVVPATRTAEGWEVSVAQVETGAAVLVLRRP